MITWSDVAKIITALGGAGVIAWFIINFIANILSKKLEARIQLKYDERLSNIEAEHGKELEEIKALFIKKNYVSKVKFDKEFQIYGELSKRFNVMIDSILSAKPLLDSYPQEKEKQKELFMVRRNKAAKSFNKARETLAYNAVFIPENIYDKFNEILELCKKQFIDFDTWFEEKYLWDWQDEDISFDRKGYRARSKDIKDKMDELNNTLRSYLETLEVFSED